ncbi:MAG: hypothetical protein K2I67_02640 [Malacoplasma sp.]|nr:hypothetical protein [Malacoplasma sp.]
MKAKRNRNKVLKFLSIIFLYILSIIGIVFGSINIGENNSKKGFYGDTYVMSFSVDTSSAKTAVEKKSMLQNNADKFSNWLLYKNISNTGVQYQLDQSNNGFIWVQLSNIAQVSYQNEDVNKSAEWAALDSINSSRVDIYQYNPSATDQDQNLSDNYQNFSSGAKKYTRVLNSSGFNYSSATKDTRTENNSYGVKLNLNSYLDITKFNSEKENSTDQSNSISWVVIQNIDVLLAKLNFAKYVVSQYNNINSSVPLSEQQRVKFLYDTMDSNLKTWADAAYGTTKNTDPISENNLLYYYELSNSSSDDSSSSNNNGVPNANSTLKTIVDNYVLGTITKDNYNNWFPDAPVVGSTSSSDDTTTQNQLSFLKTSLHDDVQTKATKNNVNSISFQPSTASESYQNDFIYQFSNTVFSNWLFPEIINGKYTIQETNFYKNAIGNAWIQQPFLENSVTTMSSYEATFLASGIILLIVAIIVSVLYRIPGLFGAFSTISSFGLSASLFVLLGINFSIPAVLGLFISVMISVFSISLFMERVRKFFVNKNSVFDSLQTSLKKSMMTIVDLNVSVIIFGLSIFFLGKGEISDFGMALILAPTITLASTFILFLYPVHSISDFTNLWKHSKHIWQIKKEVNYKINFKPNYWWIGWLIALVLGVISIVLISTIGITNSSAFNSGSTIYVLYDHPDLENQILDSLPGTWNNMTSGLSKYGYNNNSFYVLSAISVNSYDINTISNALKQINGIQSFYLTSGSPAFNVGVATSAIYGLLAAFGFSSIYYALRLNIFSVIPIFVVNVFGAIMAVSICYLTQMFIDYFFVYAMIFSSIMCNLATCMFISVSKTGFDKKNILNKEQAKTFIKNNMMSSLNTIFVVLVVNSLIMIILAVLISPTTLWLFVYIIFGTLASVWFAYFAIPHLYYYSLILRQNYVNNVINSIDKKINTEYDEVDEELIVSINKF